MWSLVNRDANIDLLFRNGLKDLEVLPPVEAWDSILPVVRRRQRPVVFLRSAALIAILVSVGFLAYRWSRELTTIVQNPQLALGEESVKYQNNTANKVALNNSGNIIPVTNDSGSGLVTGQNDTLLNPDDYETLTMDPELFPDYTPLIAYRGFLMPGDLLPVRGNISDNYSDAGAGNLDKFSYDVPRVKIDRWSIMAMASPTYYLSPVTGSDELSRQMSSSEQSHISYSGGVGFAYKINRKLSIQSGLYYSSIGQEVGGINSFGGYRPYDYTKGSDNFKVLTSSGLISTNNADVFLLDRTGDRVLTGITKDIFDPDKANLTYMSGSLYQNFSYLEMPVILRYKFIDRAVDFNLIGGLSYNLLVNNSVHTMVDGNKYSVGTTDLNPFMVSSSLGMGMEYNLSEKFSLNLEPTFRYYLNPFGSIPGVKAHPYSFGVFSGLSFKF